MMALISTYGPTWDLEISAIVKNNTAARLGYLTVKIKSLLNIPFGA